MSYTFWMEKLVAEHVHFGYFVGNEALLALHVFADCKHHPLHIPWVMRARKHLSPGLKSEIEALRLLYGRPMPSFWELDGAGAMGRTFEEDIEWLRRQPIEGFADEALSVVLRRRVKWREIEGIYHDVLRRAEGYGAGTRAFVQEILADPERGRARFLNLLTAFWESCLRTEWPGIEEQLLQDIEHQSQQLLRHGPLGMLAALSPEVSVDRKQSKVLIRRPSKTVLAFNKSDTLFLSPSYFVWPHLFVRLDKPVLINYSIQPIQQEARRPTPPDSLVKVFRALGDETRLQIVQLLIREARSTRELAGLVGLSEATVSKHLKLLQSAGIVTAQRDSYYVRYRLAEGAYGEIRKHLYSLLHDV